MEGNKLTDYAWTDSVFCFLSVCLSVFMSLFHTLFLFLSLYLVTDISVHRTKNSHQPPIPKIWMFFCCAVLFECSSIIHFLIYIFCHFPPFNVIFKLYGTALYFSLNTCLKQILFKSVFSILIKISKTFHLQKNSGDLNSEHLYSGNIWITNFYLFAIQMLANSSLFKPWTKSLLFKPCKVSDMNTLVDS